MPCLADPLNASEQRLFGNDHSAFLLRHFLVTVADNDGLILYANERFCQISSYRQEELVGKTYDLLASGKHDREFFTNMWHTVRAGQDWRGEIANRRRDGSLFWMELTIVPLPAEGDLPRRYLGIGTDISRLIEAEEQLKKREDHFQSLAETINAGIMMHQGNRLLYANQGLARMTGYSLDELLAMPFDQIAHPDYREQLNARGQARLRGENVTSLYEVPMLTKNKEVRWVEVSAGLITYHGQPAAVATAIDITEKKRAEAAQKQAQLLLSQIVEGDPVPTFVINAQHVVTHWNQACSLITGNPAKLMVGSTKAWKGFYDTPRPVLADLIVDGSIEQKINEFYNDNVYRRSPVIPGAYEVEAFFPNFGESGRWLFFTAAPLKDSKGRIIGAIETLVDITQRKLAEEALQKAHDELEELVERRTHQLAEAKNALEDDVRHREASEAELRQRNHELTRLNEQLQTAHEQLVQSEKMASIGQLAAGVAHEINNPIGYVQSNLGALERYTSDLMGIIASLDGAISRLPGEHPLVSEARHIKTEQDYEFLKDDLPALIDQSKEGIDRVRKIVADLKDFSRVDTAQEWQAANLHQCIESTLNIVNNELKYKAEIVRNYGELPEVECLPSQLNQVFLNLLVNAAHAIKERGVITIDTRYDAAAQQVVLNFSDTGSGISPEHLGRIFDPFFTTKPVGQGTGLGLSLSYGIIQKHHGSINVSSTVGEGTTFRILLPLCQPQEEGVS